MIHKGGEFQDGHIKNWFPRFDYARREGWLNRSIACLGMLFGKARSLGEFSLNHVFSHFDGAVSREIGAQSDGLVAGRAAGHNGGDQGSVP